RHFRDCERRTDLGKLLIEAFSPAHCRDICLAVWRPEPGPEEDCPHRPEPGLRPPKHRHPQTRGLKDRCWLLSGHSYRWELQASWLPERLSRQLSKSRRRPELFASASPHKCRKCV